MFANFTVKTRLFLLIALMSLLAISLSFIGLYSLKQSNLGLETVYKDRVVPLKDLKVIADMYAVNIVDTTHKVRNGNISWEIASKNVDDANKIIEEKWRGYLATVLVPEEERLVGEIKPLFDSSNAKIYLLNAILKNHDKTGLDDFAVNTLYPAIDPISEKFSQLIDVQLIVAKKEYEEAQARYDFSLKFYVFILALGLSFSVFIGFVIVHNLANSLGGEPAFAAELATNIAIGKLDNPITLKPNDDKSVIASMKAMQEDLLERIQKERKMANEAVRLKTALDCISSNVMVADEQRNIIYMNNALTKLLKKLAPQIKMALPNFNANELVGVNIDIFHKNVEHQKKLLNELEASFHSSIDIGKLKFTLTANPIQDERGQRIGFVTEWQDKTLEIAIQKEIANVVERAATGDFNSQISEEGKTGFFLELTNQLNLLMQSCSEGLNDVISVLNDVSNGDLRHSVPNNYSGQLGQLADGINTTTSNLRKLISEVQNTTEVIASSSTQITQGNSELAQRTEAQASDLQETAASMQQLSITVQQNTSNAKQANQLATGASAIAKKGVNVVGSVVGTMFNINESSHKIVDIISVIDDIAFQTNILALNAAVEAARAGDSGKGFAVVAIEVRNLAQRAANAAGEIKRLIDASVENISGGTKQVEEAGKTMQEIVSAIEKVTVIMSEISTASFEQNAGISQIHNAVTKMDSATQQNAVLVEEAANATKSLSQQAQNLVTEMAQFRTQ